MKAHNLLVKAGVLFLAALFMVSTVNAANLSTFENNAVGFDSHDMASLIKGDVFFEQTIDGPDDDWSMGTSDTGAGYVLYENFWGVAGPIEEVTVSGLAMINTGSWSQGDANDLVFDIVFYDDDITSTTEPVNVVATFDDIAPTTITTRPDQYSGFLSFDFENFVLDTPVDLEEGWISVYSQSTGSGDDWFMWGSSHDGDLYSYHAGSDEPNTAFDRAVILYGTGNAPADRPAAPTGPTSAYVDDSLTFSGVTTDPDGDDIYYLFDFGDGTSSGWLGPAASGTAVTVDHAYSYAGTYAVKVRAKDSVNGAETTWSDPLSVVIEDPPVPDVAIGTVSGGLLKLSAVIENNGDLAASSVDWSITASGNGGFILLGAETTGQITSLPVGGNVTVESGTIIGFGKALFSITAEEPLGSSDTANKYGSVFLIFIKLL